jgi:hypothetical protein
MYYLRALILSHNDSISLHMVVFVLLTSDAIFDGCAVESTHLIPVLRLYIAELSRNTTLKCGWIQKCLVRLSSVSRFTASVVILS